MQMELTERLSAEGALDAISRTDDTQSLEWPAAAGRVQQARLASGLNENEVAHRLGISVHAYGDLEAYDDEVFTVATLRDLARLSQIVSVEPKVLLLGAEAQGVEHTVTFAAIAEQLVRRISDSRVTAEKLGDEIGFRIEPILESPEALWDYSVEGLYSICKVLDVDWVTALPERAASTSASPRASP